MADAARTRDPFLSLLFGGKDSKRTHTHTHTEALHRLRLETLTHTQVTSRRPSKKPKPITKNVAEKKCAKKPQQRTNIEKLIRDNELKRIAFRCAALVLGRVVEKNIVATVGEYAQERKTLKMSLFD